MMAFQHSACFFIWAVFLLSFTNAAPAPAAEGDLAHSQALDLHNTEAGSSRCYYNFQHYEEGDRIITNEPCLNCTCHKRMLMCYLRVCPFTKPVGQDCTVEKKPDQCCPVITCPEVHVDIVTSSTTETSSAVGHIGKYGCTLEDNTFYPDGVQMPSDPKKPCELCYCIRNHTACVRQECTLNVEGCRPVYQDGVCCPVRYDCDYNEISTTERPSSGGLLLGTTASTTQKCRYGDVMYNDGELIETDKPCESCYCMRGDIVCAVRSCGEPMEGKDCHALPPPEGQCCPTTFQCANGTISIENMATESSIIMQSSPTDTDVSTKELEPQPSSEVTSDDEAEDVKNKDDLATPTTEVLPSDSPNEEENHGHKHEEEKVDEHPEGQILSEPTDEDELDDEDLDIHSDPNIHEPETEGPKISEQTSTSAPDTAEKVETETQSHGVSEVNTSESPIAISENDQVDQNKEDKNGSVKDEIKPDGNEHSESDIENTTGTNELVPEQHEIVTEISLKPEETSESKLNDPVNNEVSESTNTEVATSDAELPREPTIEKESTESKDENGVVNTKLGEESPVTALTGEENGPSNNAVAGNSLPETLHAAGVGGDEQTEPSKNTYLETESSVERDQQPEKVDGSSITNENEIKFEEIPSKTPESLDQVKESDISQETVDTNTNQYPESQTSEPASVPAQDDNQMVTNDQEKVVDVVPEQTNAEGVAPSVLPEEHIENFHKEQAPPRKEDSSLEEHEQVPQHPEGSMTKAEDSIPDGQSQSEDGITELPESANIPGKQNEHQGPGEISIPPESTENSVTHDYSNESEVNVPQEGQHGDGSDSQTQQPNVTPSLEPNSEKIETNYVSGIATESTTGPYSNDIVPEKTETTNMDIKPTDAPLKEGSVVSENESVPTVIVMEQESETSTDSLPQESSHGEVKPQTTLPEDSLHDLSNDVEDDHQSHDEQTAETEKEVTPAKPEVEEQLIGDKNSEDNLNVSFESTQSPSDIDAVTDGQTHSNDVSDDNGSLDDLNKDMHGVTDGEITSENTDKLEETALSGDGTVSPVEEISTEKEDSDQSHSDTAESAGLPNEITQNEGEKHNSDKQPEQTEGVEESTGSVIKTGSESHPEDKESEKKGESPNVESAESSKNPTPEITLPDGEVHHDPVESEPTEFDDNEFEDSGDHDPTSENEIVEDHLSGQGGSIPHESSSNIPGPVGVIPGEGDCLVDGQTYTNNSNIPSKSPCHKECTCISSIVHCQGIDCPPPPPELANCMPVHQGDLCCPVYTCDGNTPEGPQSHNQMGETEDKTDSPTETKKHSEGTEHATITGEEIPDSEHTISESETTMLDNKPTEHKEDSQGEETTAPVQNIPNTVGDEISEIASDNSNGETPGPDTVVQEHNSDDKTPADNGTAIVVTPEDNEEKPNADVSDSISAVKEKDSQPTVLTDQNESQDTEVHDQTHTESPGVEESPSKPDETPTVLEEDDGSAPHSSAIPVTETSHTLTGETQETEEHPEPEIETENGPETNTHTLTDSVDDDLPTATENNPELVSESDSHVPSEETQTENESVSPSSAEQSETPVQQIEDGKNTFETNQVSGDLPLLNEGMENNKQDIVTETPITVSQEVIKQDLPVTEEPIVSETLVTGKPNLEGNNQHDVTHKDGTYQDSESEHQPGSAVDSAVQNGSNGSETTSVEDTATEVVPNAPEGPAEVNNKVNSETDKEQNTTEQHPLHEQNINGQTDEKQNEDDSNYENVTSSTDSGSEFEGNLNSENKATLSNKENEAETNTNTAPKASHDETGNTEDLQGEVTEGSLDLHLGQSTQAPTLNDPSTQSPSPSIEHNEDLNSETATSPESIGDHVPNGDSTLDGDNTSNLTTHETPSETENQETTHDQSLETISAIKETENQKTTHDQSLETISANKDTNSDSNNHQIEPETTESLQNSDLETTEITNEIEEHVSGSPNQEEHHPEHETSQPAQEIGLPEQEISESPESSKTEDSPAEGISHDGDDGTVHEDEKIPNNFDEEPSHGTEITMGEDNNEEGNPAHGETAQVNQGTESINNEEELTKPYITETTQEETTPAQEATHEESKPANEETGSVEEDTSPENQEPSNEEVKPDIDESKLSQEESEPPHMTSKPAQEETQLGHEAGNEEPEPANDETEQAHENTQSTDETHQANEEPEIAQEDTEPIHEDSGIIHEQIVPVQGETEPEHDEIGLVHEDTEPDHEVTKPVHGESQLQGETEPAHGNTEPVHEDTEPLHGETEPAQEEIVPIHEDSETDHEKAKPVDGEAQVPVELETVQGETEPSHEGTEPAQEETEPAQEETESAQEGTEPVQEGTEPAQEGTEPAQEGTEPVHEDTEPAQEETKPIQEETEPAHTEAEPVHEQTELVHEDSEPVHEEAKPDNEETEPAHTETNPAHEDTEPAHEEIEPAHEETEPAHEETEPAHEETGPTHEETEPAHEETEPAHTEIMPAQEETESTDEESKPTQEEPELTTEKTETTHEETEHGNEVPVNEVEHDQESDTSIHDSEQSTTKTDLTSENENIPQEPENEDEHHSQEHPVLETEQTIEPIKPNTDSEHAHEAEQTPDNNIIGDGEDPSLPTGQTVDEHEQEHEQTIHETDIPHPQVPGSMPSMTGTDDSKPQHNKPDDPELPPEDQFTPDVEMDYDVSEDGAFGPGTCRYGGKVYVSAQQIPRDDPCDFCFCFRSDIICLQQSCPPPIHRCHQEPIQGYCCPRYQCPVSMATSLNITTTTSTTTTTLPPHFFAHAYRGAARQSGCFHRGRAYEVGEEITSASGPCLQCICGSDGQMQCDPKVCNPEPMVRKLMEAAVSHRRR